MQVYKAFFKVIYKNLSQIMIFFVVFLVLTILLSMTYTNPVNTSFSETKINMAFINYDKNSKFVEDLQNYLGKNANIIDLPDTPKILQDALFFRKVEYIVKVPEGFTEGLINEEDIQIEKTALPNSASGIYMDNLINKYLNTAKTYITNTKDLSDEELISYINKDLAQKSEVELVSAQSGISKNEKCLYYFNYVAYSLSAILILGICSIMIVFNSTDLKKRNFCSPLKLRNMNFQLILGNISFASITWFALIFASFILYGSYMFTTNGLLLLLNSFIFTLSALSISFLIGNIIKSKDTMSAAANVFSLGTCFISGVFVPQALLGKTVLSIASFSPTYWYVKSNSAIVNLINYNTDNLLPIFFNMLIMIGFAVAILAVALAFIKQKRMSN